MANLKTEFLLPINNFVERSIEETRTIQKKIAIDLFRRVINRTPVDKGIARANWNTTTLAPSTKFSKNKKDRTAGKNPPLNSTGTTVDNMVTKVNKAKDGATLILTNNTPYILRLEYGLYPYNPNANNGNPKVNPSGYSKQAPRGMVRLSLQETKRTLRKGNI